jgi:hypothetical protein
VDYGARAHRGAGETRYHLVGICPTSVRRQLPPPRLVIGVRDEDAAQVSQNSTDAGQGDDDGGSEETLAPSMLPGMSNDVETSVQGRVMHASRRIERCQHLGFLWIHTVLQGQSFTYRPSASTSAKGTI